MSNNAYKILKNYIDVDSDDFMGAKACFDHNDNKYTMYVRENGVLISFRSYINELYNFDMAFFDGDQDIYYKFMKGFISKPNFTCEEHSYNKELCKDTMESYFSEFSWYACQCHENINSVNEICRYAIRDMLKALEWFIRELPITLSDFGFINFNSIEKN